MFHVYHPYNQQAEDVDIDEYCSLFGRNRQDRALHMLHDVDQGFKECLPQQNGTWLVQTQTNPFNQQLRHVVSSLCGHIASCTCNDFHQNSPFDDDFECKHMILVDLIMNGV